MSTAMSTAKNASGNASRSANRIDPSLLESAVGADQHDPLNPVRAQALQRFMQTGLPTTRDEDWRYTSLAGIAEVSGQWLTAATSNNVAGNHSPADLVAARASIDAHWIEFHNGRLTDDATDLLAALGESGVELRRLDDSISTADLHLDDALASLNAALMTDPLQLRVPASAALTKPVGFLFSGEASATAMSGQNRLLIDVEEGATAEFLELQLSFGNERYFSNLVTEISLAERATVRYAKIQLCNERHSQLGQLRAELAAGSRFDHFSLDLGGQLVRNDVSLFLNGADAEADTTGLYLAGGRQHVDNHLLADHRVGPAVSRQIYRGIANGRARCVFNGKAMVREGADGTDATQSNHNLLLSDRAEINTKPELEIYADDVKCAHGATVGQLDERALFYLRTRGLDREQAAQVLTRAFVTRIVDKFPVAAAAAYVEGLVDQKLNILIGGAGNE